MRKLVLLVFFKCWLVSLVFAQDYHYTTRNYTAVDGLPQSQIMGLVEDKNGYLWMGTLGGGLARFDGREFKVYTTLDGLLSNEIYGLIIDQHEIIWILHPHGVSRFDGLHFKRFEGKELRRSESRFEGFHLYHDTLFIISVAGALSKIYNDSLHYSKKPAELKKRIARFHISSQGEVCYEMADGTFVIKTAKEQFFIKPDTEIGKVYNLFNDKHRVIIHSHHGYFLLDVAKRKITKYRLPYDIENFVLHYDERHEVYWTMNGANLIKESFANDQPKRDTVLRDMEITHVLIDTEGNTWFASNGNGLFKYFIQDFDRCTSDKLQAVMAILVDKDGASWIGTMAKGLWKIHNGKIHSYVDPDQSYRNSILTIKQGPDKTVWVGTMSGLGKYNADADKFEWFTTAHGLPGQSITTINFDHDNGMWVTTGNGIAYFKNGHVEKRYSVDNGLNSNWTKSAFYSDRYHALFLGAYFGFQKIQKDKISSINIKGFESTSIYSINSYHDSLLVAGTGGTGLLFYNPLSRATAFISTREGLASDFVYFAVPDEKDYLWVGTEKGINRMKLSPSFEVIENLHYGYDNGLKGVETNQNAYSITPKGKYFGLVDGLYQFNDLNRSGKNSFDLHLTGVDIFYGEYSALQYADSLYSFFKIPCNLSLPPDRNHVTFRFNRVDKLYPKSVKFKYYLENFDKAWSPPSSTGHVTYGNLPPGDYIFRVMATNNQGSWANTKIAYKFTVRSPFYMQTSFIVGVIILISGLITLILYIRVKQRINYAILMERIRTMEQESLRKEIARDFHDEMGNQLTRIINYVSLLKLNGHSGYNRNELYTKVETAAKYLYSGTRDFIWSIDPVNDELNKLFIHIRDFGEKLFEEKSISFRAFDKVKDKIKLPYGFSRQANLIFKEAMTNAFKYSEAKNVTLSLVHSDGAFEMIFEDDGIGFYAGTIEKSNGLKNIRERADKVNAILRISSEPRKGTKITLNFKLTKTLKYGLTI